MLTRNTYLNLIPTETYADVPDPEPTFAGDIIDCSLGTNPFGTPASASTAFRQASQGCSLSAYPQPWSQFLIQSLADYWNIPGLTGNNIILGAGSIGILGCLNKLFLAPGTEVLGFAPQFSDYIRLAMSCGAVYRAVYAEDPGLTINPEALISRLTESTAVVYVDNPNNPTGQVLPLSAIRTIATAALKYDTAVIVDEAYGEFMPQNNSAINLVPDYPNLLAVRSFSKGWGLAALRVGYGVIHTDIRPIYDRIDMPFNILDSAAQAAAEALTDPDFIAQSRKQVAILKEQLLSACDYLQAARTAPATPIMTLTCPDPAVDLSRVFHEHGVLVVDGAQFPGLTSASIRLRIPASDAPLIERLRTIEKQLSAK